MSIEARTEAMGFWRTFGFLMLAPLSGLTYALYALVFWMIRLRIPKPIVFMPVGLIFGLVNILHNFIVCTILFWEFPREFFTTHRLKRWKEAEDNTSKRELADMLGGFLNSQDEDHY